LGTWGSWPPGIAATAVGAIRHLVFLEEAGRRALPPPPLEQSATSSSLGLPERTSWSWGLHLPPLVSPPLSSCCRRRSTLPSQTVPRRHWGSRVSAKLAGINSRAWEINCGGRLGEGGGRGNTGGGGLLFGIAKR
jgi:hypothetical protein